MSIKPEDDLPSWKAFDPTEIRTLLPHLIVVNCSHDPLSFQFRLIGTYVTQIAGRDVTGRWLDRDLYGDRLEAMTWHYKRCAETREPLATLGTVHFVVREWFVAEHVFLPFAEAGKPVNRILAGLDRIDNEFWPVGHDHHIEPIIDWAT